MNSEPCNCPAYNWLHTWGIGRCYKPVAYCAECGQPCSPIRTTLAEVEGHALYEDGRRLAPYMLEPYAASDCHLAPACRDWKQTEKCTIHDIRRHEP